MKRTYMKPTTKVVQIQHRQLLSGSYNNLKSPVETYNDDQDVINEKGNIW